MQNREVPVGNLPIFFSSRQRAEAGRSRPEVWGGETGRGTRATVRGTQKTEPRARARGHGVQDAERRTQNTGYWPRAAEHGKRGHEVQKTEDAGVGRGTQNAERGTRKTWTRARARGAGDGRRGIGDGAQAPVHGPQRDCIHPPGPATTCRGRSQPGAIRRGPHPTCRAYESESRRCRRARRTCCCRAAPRPT